RHRRGVGQRSLRQGHVLDSGVELARPAGEGDRKSAHRASLGLDVVCHYIGTANSPPGHCAPSVMHTRKTDRRLDMTQLTSEYLYDQSKGVAVASLDEHLQGWIPEDLVDSDPLPTGPADALAAVLDT